MKALTKILPGLAILLCGCPKADSILNTNYQVHGTITDAGTQLPLEGVTVKLLEDREVFIKPGTLLQTAITDHTGRYSFSFTWRDSPYEVYVEKPSHIYSRPVVNKITSDTLHLTYQDVEFGKHNSELNFAMKLAHHLLVKVRNAPPQHGSDRIVLSVKKTRSGAPVAGPVNEFGMVDRDLYLGLFDPGTYVYLDYQVTHLNTTTHHLDSVHILPNVMQTYVLEY